MGNENSVWFKKGFRDGLPVCWGYLAVALTLGIAARNAGLSATQAAVTSALVNASAGEYAAFTTIAAGASYVELAIMILVANARYILMSCALSQKMNPKGPFWQRLYVGFYITDEIFALESQVPGYLNVSYTLGLMATALPGWTFGTYFGVLLGNALPANLVRALSVGLYGMFLAIIVPPARKSKVIAGLVALSMAASFLFSRLPVVSGLSEGTRIIILTVVLSGLAAALFPVSEEQVEETLEETEEAVKKEVGA